MGDSIDKNFHRRFQCVDYTTRSFHYFHSYAVLDRVDYSSLSDIPRGEITLDRVLPNSNNVTQIKQILSILVTKYFIY